MLITTHKITKSINLIERMICFVLNLAEDIGFRQKRKHIFLSSFHGSVERPTDVDHCLYEFGSVKYHIQVIESYTKISRCKLKSTRKVYDKFSAGFSIRTT